MLLGERTHNPTKQLQHAEQRWMAPVPPISIAGAPMVPAQLNLKSITAYGVGFWQQE